ncbi:serine hydrolase domain-containing protein [Algoriphagus sp.]|uniref:serine hydrolase domain-containing protein n=1 Tax=Algoriphagus sp. TaxID=1872435 RepID=UPI00262F5FEA|nr:serine hydrolase domain-containing protein [Algoriphagus sp.]
MKLKLKLIVVVFSILFLALIGIEWWRSYPKVSLPVPMGTMNQKDQLDSILITTLNQNQLAGLSVGLIVDSKITYRRAVGFANLASKDSLTSRTPLPVASISKLFTALLISSYFSQEEIQPESKIASHFPEFTDQYPKIKPLTFSSLLTHHSGLEDPPNFGAWLGLKKPRLLENQIQKALSKPSRLEPGITFTYSDFNFMLLGHLLEKNTQRPFEELMNHFLQLELAMNQSYLTTTSPLESLPTKGYEKTFLWKRLKEYPLKLEVIPDPSSGIISTTDDLLKALIQLSRGELGYLQPHLNWLRLNSGFAGFQEVKLGNQTYWGHFGGEGGFSSLLLFDPDLGNGLIILSNTADKADFRIQLAEQLEPFLDPSP